VIAGLGLAAFLRKREVLITVQTEKVVRRNPHRVGDGERASSR
jgi:hypothetical protein